MLSLGTIATTPQVIERAGGFRVLTAQVDIIGGEDPPPRIWVILVGQAPGVGWAWPIGARLWVFQFGGTSIAMACNESTVADGSNHMLIAPNSNRVRVGNRAAGPWEAFMLYTSAHADLMVIAAKIEAMATEIATLMGFPGTAWKSSLDAIGSVSGGDASSGSQGHPAPTPEVEG